MPLQDKPAHFNASTVTPPITRTLWRISNHETLSGEGGLRYAARWHSAGRAIVYLAESPAGAMIEVVVHLELEEHELPWSYRLLQVEIPEDVGIEMIRVPAGEVWKTDLALSRGLGDAWLAERRSALVRVPSAILPETWNYLLNPAHADAGQVRVVEMARLTFDARLLRHLRG